MSINMFTDVGAAGCEEGRVVITIDPLWVDNKYVLNIIGKGRLENYYSRKAHDYRVLAKFDAECVGEIVDLFQSGWDNDSTSGLLSLVTAIARNMVDRSPYFKFFEKVGQSSAFLRTLPTGNVRKITGSYHNPGPWDQTCPFVSEEWAEYLVSRGYRRASYDEYAAWAAYLWMRGITGEEPYHRAYHLSKISADLVSSDRLQRITKVSPVELDRHNISGDRLLIHDGVFAVKVDRSSGTIVTPDDQIADRLRRALKWHEVPYDDAGVITPIA